MIRYRLLAAAGVAIVAFGVVAVAIIEIVGVAPGAGILGVGGGAFAALASFLVVSLLYGEFAGPVRSVVDGIAVFGLTVVVIGATIYVNFLSLETTTVLSIALIAAVLVTAYEWPGNRGLPEQDVTDGH